MPKEKINTYLANNKQDELDFKWKYKLIVLGVKKNMWAIRFSSVQKKNLGRF